jgi:hypothetical protein
MQIKPCLPRETPEIVICKRYKAKLLREVGTVEPKTPSRARKVRLLIIFNLLPSRFWKLLFILSTTCP